MPIQRQLARKIQANETAFAVDIRTHLAKFASFYAKRNLTYAEYEVSRTPDARQRTQAPA